MDSGIVTRALRDGDAPFEVEVSDGAGPNVLFAAGRGGSPARHAGLIQGLARQGCRVMAPHFAPLASPAPTAEELRARTRRMEITLETLARPGAAVVGIGHSVGAATLLMLAGAEAWTMTRERLAPGRTDFAQLLLLAPATDFFRAPGALAGVVAPLTLWAGGEDRVTPPEKVLLLKDGVRTAVEVFIEDKAGHFTFMDEPPPNSVEPHPDRPGFLHGLTERICRMVLGWA